MALQDNQLGKFPDQHLNIFKHYSESESEVLIENNLTRAFAITLEDNAFFRDIFLQRVVPDYENKVKQFDGSTKFILNLQVSTSKIDASPEVIGLALTSTVFSENEITSAKSQGDGEQITDMIIEFGDVCIVIEVKPNASNCLSQLKTQISRINGINLDSVKYRSISWAEIIEMMESIQIREKMANNGTSRVLSDFHGFLCSNFSEWIETKPLSRFPKISLDNEEIIYRRINQIKESVGCGLNEIGGRSSFSINWQCASEINIVLDIENNEVLICVWPGDTKRQGWYVWCNDNWRKWINDRKISIMKKEYDVRTTSYIKFSHFQRGVAWVEDIENPIEVLGEDFYWKVTGRKLRPDWKAFDDYLKVKIPNWKESCEWAMNFQSSNRNYVDVSVGVKYEVVIPFGIFRKMDPDKASKSDMVEFLKATMSAMEKRVSQVGKSD